MGLDWLESSILPISNLLLTVVLVIINAIYIYQTKKTIDLTVRNANLVYNPVIGIRVKDLEITPMFGPSRRQFSADLELTNLGNAPAIEVFVDAEIFLEYSDISGEKIIPARFEPLSIPFIKTGETIKRDGTAPNFGNTCVIHLLDDFRESHRLNIHRIQTDPMHEAYNASMLKIYVWYRNSVGQYYQSTLETFLYLDEIPKDDEKAELHQLGIPRPIFHASPTSLDDIEKELAERNKKRDLCGW